MTMTCFQGHNDVGKVNVKVVFSDFKLVQIKFCIWTRLCTWHFHSICFYSRELKRHTENLTPYLFLRHCSGEICMMITCAEFCSDIYIYVYLYTPVGVYDTHNVFSRSCAVHKRKALFPHFELGHLSICC